MTKPYPENRVILFQQGFGFLEFTLFHRRSRFGRHLTWSVMVFVSNGDKFIKQTRFKVSKEESKSGKGN
jgi:hypothetical protein